MSVSAAVGKEEFSLGLEETELRLGLPGSIDGGETAKGAGKRGFEEIDLKLKLKTADSNEVGKKTELACVANAVDKVNRSPSKQSLLNCAADPAKPPTPKAQVVGWPPVRSYRKNMMSVHAEKAKQEAEKSSNSPSAAAFVKVSMDGAPYLRKVDLKLYRSYQELSTALEKMFSSFTVGNTEGINGKDFMNESKLMDLLDGSEYVPTYEDKDGDWMLVGDVPWKMFVESCKRLRIMKGSEAIGLAPRAMEKCKNRS